MLKEKALNLEDAIRNLDPTRSITVGELEKFYVEREEVAELIVEMQIQLENQYPSKAILTGHRGSGKSSTLAHLGRKLDERNRLWVVHFSIFEELDLHDLSHVDIIFVLAVQILKSCQEHNLALKGYEKRLDTWASEIEIVREEAKSIGINAEMGGGIEVPNWLSSPVKALLSVGAKVGNESSTRRKVRKEIEPSFQELLSIIDDLQQAIYAETEKRVVCLIDGCDKASIAVAEDLFYRNGHYLTAPECSIIYTFPVALRHSNEFSQISAYFSEIFILPNYKVQYRFDNEDTEKPKGIGQLKEIISRRVSYTLFDSDALEKLVYHSGGIPRTAILLAKKAIIKTLARQADRVAAVHVDAAIAEERRDFATQLSNKQLELLKGVNETKTIDNDPEAGYRELLHNLSVIEYINGDMWYGVHPLVLPLIS